MNGLGVNDKEQVLRAGTDVQLNPDLMKDMDYFTFSVSIIQAVKGNSTKAILCTVKKGLTRFIKTLLHLTEQFLTNSTWQSIMEFN